MVLRVQLKINPSRVGGGTINERGSVVEGEVINAGKERTLIYGFR